MVETNIMDVQVCLLFCILAIVSTRTSFAVDEICAIGDACIDIRQCDLFAPYYNEPSRWSTSLKDNFRRRVCQRESSNGVNMYKVCCPNPAVTTPATVQKRRGDLLDLGTCGVLLIDRVAFGEDAVLFEYPWMALLRSRGEWTCGGTLINERYVLTAAHCVKNEVLDFVRLGEFELSRAIDCDRTNAQCAPPPQDIAVARVIIHDKYSARQKQNDIALLRLARPVSLNSNVNPICLPVTTALQKRLPKYAVAGWGSTASKQFSDKLQFARMNLMSKSSCSEWLSTVDKYLRISDTQVCTLGERRLSEHCAGDSGGPLQTVSTNGRYVLHGVVSFGLNSCGKENFPGVYTKVQSFNGWILDNLEE